MFSDVWVCGGRGRVLSQGKVGEKPSARLQILNVIPDLPREADPKAAAAGQNQLNFLPFLSSAECLCERQEV